MSRDEPILNKIFTLNFLIKYTVLLFGKLIIVFISYQYKNIFIV